MIAAQRQRNSPTLSNLLHEGTDILMGADNIGGQHINIADIQQTALRDYICAEMLIALDVVKAGTGKTH